MWGRLHIALLALVLCSSSAHALTLEDCTRTTHPSHGGEVGHRDMGAGHVFWTAWWSQEGVFKDFWVAHCESGLAMKARLAEDRMGARTPFDRTDLGLAIIDRHDAGSDAFLKLDTIAHDLRNIGEDIALVSLEAEVCACAAVYPGTNGPRDQFEMDQ